MGSANLRPAKPRDPWQTGKLAINEFITWIAARVSIARHVCHAWPRTWQTGKLVNNDYGCFRLMRAAGLSPTIRQSTRDRALAHSGHAAALAALPSINVLPVSFIIPSRAEV